MGHFLGISFHSLAFCLGIMWCLSVLAFPGTDPVVVEGQAASPEPGYEPIMLSTHEQVSARLLQSLLFDGRFAVVQTRVSRLRLSSNKDQGNLPAYWHLDEQNTLVIDCMNSSWGIAVLQKERNIRSGDIENPEWRISASNADFIGMSLDKLKFFKISGFDRPLSSLPQKLEPPAEWQVAAAFACETLLHSNKAVSSSEVAFKIRSNGGYRDLHKVVCQTSDFPGKFGANLVFYYSPSGNSVLLGDKWIINGVLYESYMSVSDENVELRLIRKTGEIRLILRSESKTIGGGVCQTELIDGF